MATHSSIPAWEIPQTDEPGGLQSMGHKELDTTEWLNNNNNVSDYHTKNQIEGIVILG